MSSDDVHYSVQPPKPPSLAATLAVRVRVLRRNQPLCSLSFLIMNYNLTEIKSWTDKGSLIRLQLQGSRKCRSRRSSISSQITPHMPGLREQLIGQSPDIGPRRGRRMRKEANQRGQGRAPSSGRRKTSSLSITSPEWSPLMISILLRYLNASAHLL